MVKGNVKTVVTMNFYLYFYREYLLPFYPDNTVTQHKRFAAYLLQFNKGIFKDISRRFTYTNLYTNLCIEV